jgi:hypothetical protein
MYCGTAHPTLVSRLPPFTLGQERSPNTGVGPKSRQAKPTTREKSSSNNSLNRAGGVGSTMGSVC